MNASQIMKEMDEKCKNILNVGCGTGYDFVKNLDYFKENNVSWFGVEYSKFMVEDGIKNGIPIKQGDIYNLENVIEDNFDCCLALDIFEHLNDFESAFIQMKKRTNNILAIAFFKKPLPKNSVITINKHINEKDCKKTETMEYEYIQENPGYRKGQTKNCYYNIHNKNSIEEIMTKNNLKFRWLSYDENDDKTILLICEKRED